MAWTVAKASSLRLLKRKLKACSTRFRQVRTTLPVLAWPLLSCSDVRLPQDLRKICPSRVQCPGSPPYLSSLPSSDCTSANVAVLGISGGGAAAQKKAKTVARREPANRKSISRCTMSISRPGRQFENFDKCRLAHRSERRLYNRASGLFRQCLLIGRMFGRVLC